MPENSLPRSFSYYESHHFLLMFQSVRLDAIMRGVSSMLREKSLWSRFWTILLGPYPDLTANSTLGKITLSIVVKIVS